MKYADISIKTLVDDQGNFSYFLYKGRVHSSKPADEAGQETFLKQFAEVPTLQRESTKLTTDTGMDGGEISQDNLK